MALATSPPSAAVLSYDDYLAEGYVEGDYDIVDGVRIFMSGASWRHQRIQKNVMKVLDRYEETLRTGYMVGAPYDVLIRKQPLRMRQPDVLFISKQRLEETGGAPTTPLEAAPEVVVEIISDSERKATFAAKLKDYASIGVLECWKMLPDDRAVEVIRLDAQGSALVALFTESEVLVSNVLPGFAALISELFAE